MTYVLLSISDICVEKYPLRVPKSNCGYKKATWDETEWNIHPPQIPNIKLQIQCHNQVNFNLCHFLYCWLGNSKFQITLLCLYLNLICKQNQRRKAESVCSVKSLKTDSIFFRKVFMRYHYTHTWQWVLEECNRNYFTLEINNGSKLRCTYLSWYLLKVNSFILETYIFWCPACCVHPGNHALLTSS